MHRWRLWRELLAAWKTEQAAGEPGGLGDADWEGGVALKVQQQQNRDQWGCAAGLMHEVVMLGDAQMGEHCAEEWIEKLMIIMDDEQTQVATARLEDDKQLELTDTTSERLGIELQHWLITST